MCFEDYGVNPVIQDQAMHNKLFLSSDVRRIFLFTPGESGATGQVQYMINHSMLESRRGWCSVAWHKGTENNLYRIGSGGKVDIIATEPSSGGYYFPSHLAALGSAESMPLTGKRNMKARNYSFQDWHSPLSQFG
jgi:hypothetical protein